ncbi:DEAD/DEAH box helicase [Vibrio splendidus]
MSAYNQTVPFWPEDKSAKYNSVLPLLYRLENNYLDKNWPDNGEGQEAVISQLKSTNKAWASSFKPKDTVIVTLLIGKYKITINVAKSEEKPRLWVSRIYYANNQDRQRMLEHGTLLEFDGIEFLTGREFGNGLEARDIRFKYGLYATELLDAINSPWNVEGEELEPEQAEEEALCYEEQEMVDVLRCFIDSEYELERIAAQQCMPFNATSISARSERTTYRLHYEITLDEFDYSRLLEVQPTLLEMLDEMREPTDILLEVADLTPVENEPIIHVSIEKQALNSQIPDQALLAIAALPTLKKVRNSVVDSLESESSKNPWLLPLAAKVYQHEPLTPVKVPLPPSKFPPTQSQVKAIDSGAGSNDYTLVLGPPGTGKTTVILQWVKYFAAQGKRVLVTSQNNKAVDNVLERLAEEDDFECLRIGNENKISSCLEDITLDNKAAELQARMFSSADETLKNLESQLTYIHELLASRNEIIAKMDNADKAQSDHIHHINRQKSLHVELAEIESHILSHDNVIRRLNAQLKEIEHKEWPIFKSVSRWINTKKTNLVNSRIESSHIKSGKLSESRTTTMASIANTEKSIEEAQQLIESCNQKIDGYFRKVTSLVDEVVLPGQSEDRVTKLELVQLDELLRKVSGIHSNLTQWFNKLKTERQQALYKILIENVNVVGATCIGINTKALFRELDFDVVIVDESGQIQLHNLIVPLSRANKAILVGDHKQLPPVVSDEVLEEVEAKDFGDYKDLYRLSWFEHLWNAAPDDRKIMLDTQFRCPSIISDFVSEAFYEGNYFAGVGMDKKKPLLSYCPQPMIWIDTTWLENKGEKSTSEEGRAVVQNNVCETNLVIELLKSSIQEMPELAENREIGVIVPYANHVKAIQNAICREQKRGELLELKMPLNELVASVDSFQGQERDLIIFTFTRSNRQGKVGFLADWRRLNVAQTRAKKQLVMIGDSQTLTKGAGRENAHDVEFKKAMVLLKSQCYEKGALIQASRFLPNEKTVQRPQNPSFQNKRQAPQNRHSKTMLVSENG